MHSVSVRRFEQNGRLKSKRIVARPQEKGNLDPYRWIGRFGLGVSGLLKKVHNGLLPWYLSWILLGTVVLLFIFQFLL